MKKPRPLQSPKPVIVKKPARAPMPQPQPFTDRMAEAFTILAGQLGIEPNKPETGNAFLIVARPLTIAELAELPEGADRVRLEWMHTILTPHPFDPVNFLHQTTSQIITNMINSHIAAVSQRLGQIQAAMAAPASGTQQ